MPGQDIILSSNAIESNIIYYLKAIGDYLNANGLAQVTPYINNLSDLIKNNNGVYISQALSYVQNLADWIQNDFARFNKSTVEISAGPKFFLGSLMRNKLLLGVGAFFGIFWNSIMDL